MRRDVNAHFRILRLRRRLAGESGFTLIEVVLAMVLFAGIAAAMAGLLTSAVSANKLARQRTIADQAALERLEVVRRMPYVDVGIVLGNPPGQVSPTYPVALTGLKATITMQISYVDDPTPTSYETTANYKRVIATVRRDDDGKVLAREITYVAPTARTPFGGVNLATVEPSVIDYYTTAPVEGVTVNLLTGPSAPRSDVTDATGQVSFAKLTPNPTANCPSDCYDLTAALSGYVQLDAPTRINVGPGQTLNPTIQIYRPSVINLAVNSGGSPYAGTAFVKVTSARNGFTQTFSVTGGSLAVPTVNGEPIVPNTQYTAEAWTTGTPSCATPVTDYVPDDYPNVLSTTFPLNLGACPSGSVLVTVTWGGSPAPAATVTLSDGPYALSPPASGMTNVAGQITFSNVPSGAGYTIQATKATTSVTAPPTSVTTGSTTNVSMALEAATLVVNVKRSGVNQSAATVRLTGGPNGINVLSAPPGGGTNGSGNVTFTNVPVGTGYTIQAWKCSAFAPRRSGSLTPVAIFAGTNNRNVTFDISNVCPLP